MLSIMNGIICCCPLDPELNALGLSCMQSYASALAISKYAFQLSVSDYGLGKLSLPSQLSHAISLHLCAH